MDHLVPGARNAVRALIISDGRILLLRKDGGFLSAYPGKQHGIYLGAID